MSRLFNFLSPAMFTLVMLVMPACDDEDPKDTKDPSTTAEDSSSDGSSTAVGPDDLAPPEDETGGTTGDDDKGTATLAGPHISTDATV